MTLVLALVSIAMSVAAQFILKSGVRKAAGMTPESAETHARVLAALMHPHVLAGLALYAASAVVWLAVLSKWDVSKAYPMVGLGFVLSLPIGLALGEQVGVTRGLGVLLIALGVYLVSRT